MESRKSFSPILLSLLLPRHSTKHDAEYTHAKKERDERQHKVSVIGRLAGRLVFSDIISYDGGFFYLTNDHNTPAGLSVSMCLVSSGIWQKDYYVSVHPFYGPFVSSLLRLSLRPLLPFIGPILHPYESFRDRMARLFISDVLCGMWISTLLSWRCCRRLFYTKLLSRYSPPLPPPFLLLLLHFD